MPEFEKLVRNGEIAVVYSPGYGAGWSTWNDERFAEALCMDSEIAEAVISEDYDLAKKIAEEKHGASICGSHKLRIEWVPKGVQFRVSEYDGFESVVLSYGEKWFTA